MKFASKKELLEDIAAEHEKLMALAGTIPQKRYNEAGVWGDGWTIKDLFAHLTEWHEMFLGWHRQGLAGEVPEMPAPGYFAWTKKHPMTSYLAPNTRMHYRTAVRILKRWLRQQKK